MFRAANVCSPKYDGFGCPPPRRRAIPEGPSTPRGVVRDVAARSYLFAPTPDSADRDRFVGPTGGGDLRRALGDRALVSPSEALVGSNQAVATAEGCARTDDAASLHRLCLDAIARASVVGVLSADGHRALEKGCQDQRRAFRSMAAHEISRASRAQRLPPEIRSIRNAFSQAGSAFAVLSTLARHRPA